MKTRYHKTFEFKNTETEARFFCELKKLEMTPYMRRAGYVPTYTPWDSGDGKEHLFVVWYYTA